MLLPSAGTAPLVVTADASGSTDTDATPIATYLFNFGDGSPAIGPSSVPVAYHTYQAVGTYTILLTVTDTAGFQSTTTGLVRVLPPFVDLPPTPALVIQPSSGVAPLTARLPSTRTSCRAPTP